MNQLNLEEQQKLLLVGLIQPWADVQANQNLALQQAWPQAQYLRGLQAYRANAEVLAQQVLARAYPTIKRLMSDEQFNGFAIHFWRSGPPSKGDLAQWGEGLADFLRAIPELMAHEPYLPDIAALEWALHEGLTVADPASDDPMPLSLINSEFPIVDLVHGKNWEDIIDKQPQRALVYRQGFRTACIALPKEAVL